MLSDRPKLTVGFNASGRKKKINTLSKLYGEMFVNKCETESNNLHAILRMFTVAGTSHINWISDIILYTYSLAFFSPLAPELFFLILAHPVYIKCE